MSAPTFRRATRHARLAAILLAALLASASAIAFNPATASASTRQISIVEENNGLNAHPMATLEKMKGMGVTLVKYSIAWRYLLPARQNGSHAPRGSGQPRFYNGDFGQLAEIDQDAHRVGIQLGFLITSPDPTWAQTSTTGCDAYGISHDVCNPSTQDFKVFMEALGRYFSGSVAGVPAVRWWSVWNEPNYGVDLAPQLYRAGVVTAADEYRNLLDAAWSALTGTGHPVRTDTIVFGDLAPRGISGPTAANAQGVKPVQFLASLYCVTVSGRRLSGRTGAANGCPGSAATFRRQNPALFDSAGIADHPYGQGISPATRTGDCHIGAETFCIASGRYPADPLWTDLASITNLEHGLDRDVRAEGSDRKLPIWNTEYGYWTSPPGSSPCLRASDDDCDLRPATAAVYLNQAEYISYRNPRIVSFDQYQLYQPPGGAGGWTDGLLMTDGQPEVTYDAWELPLWIVSRRRSTFTVWGGVRPASAAEASAGVAPVVHIEFRTARGGWKTLKTVTAPTGSMHPGSYFTTSVRVPARGSLRLVYFERHEALYSRTQAVR